MSMPLGPGSTVHCHVSCPEGIRPPTRRCCPHTPAMIHWKAIRGLKQSLSVSVEGPTKGTSCLEDVLDVRSAWRKPAMRRACHLRRNEGTNQKEINQPELQCWVGGTKRAVRKSPSMMATVQHIRRWGIITVMEVMITGMQNGPVFVPSSRLAYASCWTAASQPKGVYKVDQCTVRLLQSKMN